MPSSPTKFRYTAPVEKAARSSRKRARPRDVGLVVGRVLPHAERVHDEAGVAGGQRRRVLPDAGDGAAPADHEELRGAGGHRLRPGRDRLDGGVGQVDEVLGGPVVPEARRVVDHALEVRVRHRAEVVDLGSGGAELAQRLAPLVQRPGVHAGDRHHQLAVQVLGDLLLGRRAQVQEGEAQPFGGVAHDVAVERHQLAAAGGRVERQPGEHLALDRVQAELERGDHAEVAAAAAQRPEQLGMLVRGRAHLLALGGHELDGEQVVAGQAVLALEPAGPAAEREAGHAGGRHAAAGGGEAVGLGGAVELRPGRAGADARDPALGVDLDRRHAAHVDHEPVVDEREPGDRVPAGADREREPFSAGVGDRVGDVRRRGAARHHRGPALDHRVVERRGVGVLGSAGLVQVHAAKLRAAARRDFAVCGHPRVWPETASQSRPARAA